MKLEQANAFFRLVEQRYDRESTIIATNLEPTEWYLLYQNRSLLDAPLDRLQHHCITIRVTGPSLRTPQPAAPAAADDKAARRKNSTARSASAR